MGLVKILNAREPAMALGKPAGGRVRNVYLAQVNNKFGENKVFFPYSVGLLQAYAKAQPDIKESYQFARPIFLRENPRGIAKSLDNPDVLGISCYIWNWEWSNSLAREAKKIYPDALVVMGGPQVPNRSDGFFQEHPYVDLLVHGEGEIIFSDILRERLKENPDYARIPGLTIKENGSAVKTMPKPRLTVDELPPSPYTTGEFDELLRDFPDLEFHVTSETHRGCPYSCTFCDWGSAVFQKVRQMPNERIRAEYDWVAQKKIPLIYNADANFGIFERDVELTDYLISLKKSTGFPQQLRANWAKNSHERMFNMAKKLTEAEMGIGVTLSLQSLDTRVLEIIKRKNIKFDNFTNLVRRYEEAGIPTYTELILALPGETYESFANGLETLFEGGQHEGVNIYLCTLLPNSEMSNPEYIAKHGIRSVRSPILQNHATPGEDPITEYSDMVIATDSMPPEDFRKSFLFSWATQTFHSIGLARDIAIHLKKNGIPFRNFYEKILSAYPDTVIGRQITLANKCLDRALSGGEWGEIDPKYGQVIWPLEEFSFLNFVTGNLDGFYSQLEGMINKDFISLPREIIQRQRARLRTPEEFDGDIKKYAREAVWFGRKFGSALRDLDCVNPIRTDPYADLESMASGN